jgi:protein arginine N-methyltransferase 1
MPMAKANGFADRITVVRDMSTNYAPETKADVIVSDCRGTVSLYQHHIATLADARARLLAPGGTLLPMRDTLHIALAHWPMNHRGTTSPWLRNKFGLDLSAGHSYAANLGTKAYLKPRNLRSAPSVLAVIDYRSITEPNLDVPVRLEATSSGPVHGLLVWFDAEIAEGLGYSNAPGQPELVYGQLFLPLAGSPRMAEGERIEARVRANLIDDEYYWTWDWQIHDAAGQPRGTPMRQSTFLSQLHAPKALANASNQHVPQLGAQLLLDRDCLALVGEGRTLDAIATILQQRHPKHLPTYKAALDHAAKCLGRYSN